MRTASAPFRLTVPALRGVLAMLALLSQLTLGSIGAPQRAAAATNAGLQDVVALCVGGAHARPAARHEHRDAQDARSGGAPSLELPASILPGVAMLPVRLAGLGGRTARLPPLRAPPAPAAPTVRARAPPSSS